jgi:putative ABC transport system substrate-binding protein
LPRIGYLSGDPTTGTREAFRQGLKDFGMYPIDDFVEAGGLMSYSPNNETQHRRAATFVDEILKGAKPSDLPIEAPTKFDFVINLKAAKQIGVTIPQSLLYRADKVIK